MWIENGGDLRTEPWRISIFRCRRSEVTADRQKTPSIIKEKPNDKKMVSQMKSLKVQAIFVANQDFYDVLLVSGLALHPFTGLFKI